MPKYRYWLLVDEEDDNCDTVRADDSAEAAEIAASEIYSDDGQPPKATTIELAVRMVGENGFPEGPVQMFEVYIDWEVHYNAAYRGIKGSEHHET